MFMVEEKVEPGRKIAVTVVGAADVIVDTLVDNEEVIIVVEEEDVVVLVLPVTVVVRVVVVVADGVSVV